ncbi:MAG: RHS repeat-associated core domain-containing protein [Planctomycetota bacterium]
MILLYLVNPFYLLADDGQVVVSKYENGATFTLTAPERIHTGQTFAVNVDVVADDPYATVQWAVYENGTYIAGSGFAWTPVHTSVNRTPNNSGPFEYKLQARAVSGGHGWPPYTYLYNTTAEDNNTGSVGNGSACDLSSSVYAGSVVDAGSGNLNLDYTLTNIVPINNLPHNLTVYYNSQDVISPTFSSPLGANWTHTFNQTITQTNATGLVYIDGTGNRIFYRDTNGDNVFEPLARYGSYSVISKTVDSFTLYRKDRTVLTFNASGRLTQMTDINGQQVNLTYTGNNLTLITLPNSSAITLTYNVDNRIETIEDPAGNTTTLTYTNGLLSGISKPDNWAWAFTYKTGTNLIETVTNPLLDTTTYGYTTDNNLSTVTKTVNGQSKSRIFNYITSTSTFTLSDFNGITRTTKYNYRLRTWENRIDALNNTISNTFDGARNLLSQTDTKGSITRYAYDTRGNIISSTDVADCTTQYRYEDPANPDLPTQITDPRNVSTYFEYDNNGNMTRRAEALGLPIEQVTVWEYYTITDGNPAAVGRVKKETRASGDLNLVTDFYYTTGGYLYQKVVDQAGLNIVYQTDYTVLGQVWKTYCPRSMQTNFEYTHDSRGNQKTIRTYINPTTSYLTTLDYDLMDRLTSRKEDDGGLNIATEYQYDNLGRLLLTTLDPSGLNIQTQNVYDDAGRITQVIDPETATTSYTYFSNGWLKTTTRQLTDSEYASTEYSYDGNGNRKAITDPQGHTTVYTYNAKNQLTGVTDPANYTTTYDYETCGCCAAAWVTDPRGNTTYTKYDELKRVKFVRTPEQNITTAYIYDKAGRNTQVIGPWKDANQNGTADDADSANVRYSAYDKADRVIESWVNSHPKTYYQYDKASNITRITDPESHITESTYDRCSHLLTMTVDPTGLNEKTKYGYDTIGRQTVVTAAYGTAMATETVSIYDKASRVITSYTGSVLYATSYQYDKRGQQTAVTDAEGKTTRHFFDKGGRLIKTQDARGYDTDYVYNKDGLRTKVTYYHGSTAIDTTYTYYNNHLLWVTTMPGYNGLQNVTTNSYDGNGNLTSKTDARNQTIVYTYDFNNRLTGKLADQQTYYTYDSRSNLLTVVDANSNIVNLYDDLNRLITQTQTTGTLSKTIGYGYYEDGTRSSMLDPEGNNIGYTYDKAKRLLTVTRNSVTEAAYQYNTLGLRTKLTLGNNAFTDYTYDSVTLWLTGVYNYKADGITIVSSFVYTHDKVGNRKTMTLSDGSVIAYGYDSAYQLISEVRTVHSAYQLSWGYDNVGNRITQTKNALLTLYNYNDANQLLTEITGSTVTTYQYDNNGNLTVKTDPAGTITFGYDYENRQTSFNAPGTTNDATYIYNSSGARISKTVNSVTEKYILDGVNTIADYDGSNNLKATYVTPFLDQNLLTVQVGDKWYYMHDGLGSVRSIMKGNSEKKSYDYYAFGEMRDEKTFGNLQGFYNRYKFTSREWDSESANYYYRARYYTPTNGRFTARDPIGYLGGLNLYSYVKNNPVRYTDPFGFVACTDNVVPDITASGIGEGQYVFIDPLVSNAFSRPDNVPSDADAPVISGPVVQGGQKTGCRQVFNDDGQVGIICDTRDAAKSTGNLLGFILGGSARLTARVNARNKAQGICNDKCTPCDCPGAYDVCVGEITSANYEQNPTYSYSDPNQASLAPKPGRRRGPIQTVSAQLTYTWKETGVFGCKCKCEFSFWKWLWVRPEEVMLEMIDEATCVK